MSFGQILAQQAGGSAAGALLGMALQGHNDRRQVKQQGRLQAQQIQGAKEMQDYQYQKALEYWGATGPKAQMEKLKEAGLNPALMYGMGGATGGQSQSFSGTPGGAAAPAGGREVQDIMGMGLQMRMMAAQTKNIEADTKLKEATAGKTAGVDTAKVTAEIDNLKQTLKNLGAQEALTNMETRAKQLENMFNSATIEHRKGLIYEQYEQAEELTEIIKNQREVSDATKNNQIKQVGATLADTIASAALKTKQGQLALAQTGKTEEETRLLFKDYLLRQWQTETNVSNTNQNSTESRHRVMNDNLTEGDKQAYDMFGKLLQALGIGSIISKGAPTQIRGFR